MYAGRTDQPDVPAQVELDDLGFALWLGRNVDQIEP